MTPDFLGNAIKKITMTTIHNTNGYKIVTSISRKLNTVVTNVNAKINTTKSNKNFTAEFIYLYILYTNLFYICVLFNKNI